MSLNMHMLDTVRETAVALTEAGQAIQGIYWHYHLIA
jgi:hypothetical protein